VLYFAVYLYQLRGYPDIHDYIQVFPEEQDYHINSIELSSDGQHIMQGAKNGDPFFMIGNAVT
jgi:hypothetical protein